MSTTLRTDAEALIARIPGAATVKWPQGERFGVGLAHGSMSVELYVPKDIDPQTPHAQDELYVVHSGTAMLEVGSDKLTCSPGSVCFVPAGEEHRFVSFSPDFATWVIFWGPPGGERAS